jgi:sec-independent protein translocase protein TatA
MNAPSLPLAFLPGGSEWIVIALVVLLLFGAKRLPELARSLGKGMTEFKKAMHEATSEFEKVKDELQTAASAEPEPKKTAPPADQKSAPPDSGQAQT